VSATVESCIAQNFADVANECIRSFKQLADFSQSIQDNESAGFHLVIESEILQATVTEVQKVLAGHDIQDEVPPIFCLSKELFSIGPSSPPFILGEQPIQVHEELRSLYFGLKNIVLVEI